jgi:hypothetical protein
MKAGEIAFVGLFLAFVTMAVLLVHEAVGFESVEGYGLVRQVTGDES